MAVDVISGRPPAALHTPPPTPRAARLQLPVFAPIRVALLLHVSYVLSTSLRLLSSGARTVDVVLAPLG